MGVTIVSIGTFPQNTAMSMHLPSLATEGLHSHQFNCSFNEEGISNSGGYSKQNQRAADKKVFLRLPNSDFWARTRLAGNKEYLEVAHL